MLKEIKKQQRSNLNKRTSTETKANKVKGIYGNTLVAN
jgi:hypothetical protein